MNSNIKIKKIIATLILIAFVLVSVFSTTFIIQHLNHNCTGYHCETCTQIESALSTLKILAATGLIGVFSMIRLLLASFQNFNKNQSLSTVNLVSLKVRMNN